MNYEISIQRKAQRNLARTQRRDRDRIIDRIHDLGVEPRPQGSTRLSGVDAWRIRVGNYRVIYTIDDTVRVVDVINVGHRRDIYRRL